MMISLLKSYGEDADWTARITLIGLLKNISRVHAFRRAHTYVHAWSMLAVLCRRVHVLQCGVLMLSLNKLDKAF
jgi:hypothetical protein